MKTSLPIRMSVAPLMAALLGWFAGLVCAEPISIVLAPNAAPRVEFGAEKLVEALEAVNLEATVVHSESCGGTQVLVDEGTRPGLSPEAFRLTTLGNDSVSVTGGDDSGALYGCLELAQRIRDAGRLPGDLNLIDGPVIKLRGTCIGLQKPFILPGRRVYEYPITPGLFPWFYNRELWREYLDFLVQNRMNTLYLWNGHPFASLVRLKKYPYAVEVPENVFRRNQKMFHWLTRGFGNRRYRGLGSLHYHCRPL